MFELFTDAQPNRHILSTTKAYLCVIAAERFLNNPQGHINTGMVKIFIPSCAVVCGLSTLLKVTACLKQLEHKIHKKEV